MDAEGATTQISHVTDAPSSLEWSPDGKSLAFTMNVPVKDNWRIAMPTPPKGAKWTEPPKVVTRLNYRSDRVGYTDDAYRHIFVDSGRRRHAAPDHERRLEPLRRRHSRPTASGSPSRRSASRTPRMPFRKSQIYAANLETGEIKQLTHRNGTNAAPSYSPDGKMIAFMSADSVDHSAWAETKLWVMNADGSNAHLVSGTLDRPISGRRLGARTTAACTSTSRAKVQRTCISRRAGGQFASGDERQARAHRVERRQDGARRRHPLDADEAERRRDVHGAEDRHRRRRSRSSPPSTTTCSPARSSRRPKRSGTRRRTASRSRAGS